MRIGRKIYYEKATSNIILITSQMEGGIRETTFEEDISFYIDLQNRVPETIGCLKLEYGQYAEDFGSGGIITRVDPVTGEVFFTYPNPEQPEPQEPQKPLTEQVAQLRQADIENKQAIADLTMTLAAMMGVK